jgi:hypothetical protein
MQNARGRPGIRPRSRHVDPAMAFYEAAFFDSGIRYDDIATAIPHKKGRIMAGNPIPDLRDDLLSLAEDMADGLQTHQVAIGIAQNTETVVRAAITSLRTTEADAGMAKDQRQAAADAVEAADAAAYEFIGKARGVLAQFLGNRWNAAWEPTGFPDQSTAVPRTQEKRLNLCASLKIYFTSVPAHAVPALGVTAALADAAFTALSDARDALAQKTADQTTKLQLRDVAERNLRKRVRGCIEELYTLLADADGRWHAFGLNMPADPDTPEAVASLTLTANMAGKVVVAWPRARRATRYRIFTKVLTVDPEFVNVETVHDLEFMLTGLPSGQTLQVYVVAANDAGEAPASPTEQIVIP